MDVTYLHGPDRVPLQLAMDGVVAATGGLPFHGIASRGLLGWLDRQPGGAELWERLAHRLHDGTDAGEPALVALRAAAAGERVLSLAQSAQAARRFVEAHCAHGVTAPIAACELWNTKEGHTSSVWVVALGSDPEADGHRFVVNVARDAAAAAELRATSEHMRAVSAACPELPIAAVLDIATVEVDGTDGPLPVTVTRNELVPAALEVHRLGGDGGQDIRYALVERFIAADDAPARICAVRGRVASARERESIDGVVERLLAAAGPDDPIGLDINDGDVVWDGQRAVVVAFGAPGARER